nr:DUF2300 domain-containing protein [Yersinia pekkanenii]
MLTGSPVNYHCYTAAPSRLSWLQAIQQAGQGMRFGAILAHAFPPANLSHWDNPSTQCQPLPAAGHW